MMTIVKWALTLSLIPTGMAYAAPGDICESDKLYLGCSTDVISKAESSAYQCLQKYLACGKYEEVTTALDALNDGPNQFQRYYLGAAYYALQVETVSPAEKCSRVISSRKHLEVFLLDALEEFDSVGTFVSFPIQHIRHAQKLVADLNKQPCIDSVIDLSRAKQLAERYGHERMKDLFFQAKPVCAEAGNDAIGRMTTVGCNMQDFVTHASDIEGGIALRNVELDTLKNYLLGPVLTPETSTTPEKRAGGIDIDSLFITEVKETESLSRAAKIRNYSTQLFNKTLQLKALFVAQMERLGITDPNDLQGQIQSNNNSFSSLLELSEGQRTLQSDVYFNSKLTDIKSQADFDDPVAGEAQNLLQFWKDSAQGLGMNQRCSDGAGSHWYCQEDQP